MNRRILVLVVVFLVLISLGGYVFFLTGVEPAEIEVSEEEIVLEEPEEIVEPEPEPEVRLENENVLTGLPTLSDEAVGLRPVAVMISNVRASMPQNGIGAADLIFEIPVEGGATRLMAVYGDMTQIPMISPVRSARPYFAAMSVAVDALYAHWGNDPYIDHDIEYFLGENRFDGAVNTGGLFGRDQNRLNAGFTLEHTAYFDGTRFKGVADNLDFRLDLREDGREFGFLFNPFQEVATPSGGSASSIHVDFRGTTADFAFDEESRLYVKDFNGTPHIDGITGEPLAFTNVLVLETDIWVNWIGHNAFDFNGAGFYFSDGAVQSITWEMTDRLRFFDEDGAELRLNRGTSYIGITHVGTTTFES